MEKLKYNFTGTDKEIISIVDNFKEQEKPKIDSLNEYAKGNNPIIINRRLPPDTPQNRISISYGRRMINLVTGYMFKPGLIQYACEDETYLDSLMEVFKYNEEPLETEQIGRQVSTHGVAYELFFNESLEDVTMYDGTIAPDSLMPRFVKIPVNSTIPIYNYDIIPTLTHFIRFYSMDETETEYIEVYDATTKRMYTRSKEGNAGLSLINEEAHGFKVPPLIVYENNEDRIGDFQCVVPLIDAYDVLISDSMNEFDRFAYAYLVMKGFSLSKDDLNDLKYKRVFALLGEKDMVEFLTKDINHEFIKFMAEWLRGEIHKQSGIPNLDDVKFGGQASGETLSKWLYLMEIFTDPKQSYFEQSLKKRIALITEYAGLSGDPTDIEIIMNRNVPDKSMEQAELMEKYAGHISEKTLIENFADFVKDVDAEMEQLKAEKEESLDTMMANMPPEEEEPEDEAGNEVPKENT